MEDKIKKALEHITKDNKDFVIYPYGKWGKVTKQILNEEFGIYENYIVDNYYQNEEGSIKSIEYLMADYKERKFHILVAVDPACWKTSLDIHRSLSFADVGRMDDILARSTYFCSWNYFDVISTLKWPKISVIECISREIYINGVWGDIAEAGVFQGNTARFINTFFPDRKLYLFDTFEGFSDKDIESEDSRDMYHMDINFKDTTVDYVLSRMHFPKNVVIKKGWFPESAKGIEEKFALVRLDMDLYDPTYSGLNLFWDKISPGGYIVVHDCRSTNFDGARQALLDFCKEKNVGYYNSPDNLGSAVICKGMR